MSSKDFSPIALMRFIRGLSQSDVAIASGMSAATLSNVETGRRVLSSEEVSRIAAALACPPETITTGSATLLLTSTGVQIEATIT